MKLLEFRILIIAKGFHIATQVTFPATLPPPSGFFCFFGKLAIWELQYTRLQYSIRFITTELDWNGRWPVFPSFSSKKSLYRLFQCTINLGIDREMLRKNLQLKIGIIIILCMLEKEKTQNNKIKLLVILHHKWYTF